MRKDRPGVRRTARTSTKLAITSSRNRASETYWWIQKLVEASGASPWWTQNAIKHAAGATVTVRLTTTGDGSLCLVVEDDGPGFDPVRPGGGTGLVGMADRLGAVGGTLRIDAAPGAGTRVGGRLPAVPQ